MTRADWALRYTVVFGLTMLLACCCIMAWFLMIEDWTRALVAGSVLLVLSLCVVLAETPQEEEK